MLDICIEVGYYKLKSNPKKKIPLYRDIFIIINNSAPGT